MSVIGRSVPRAAGSGLDIHLLAPVFTTVFVGMLWWIGFRPFVSQAAGDIGSSVPVVGQVLTLGALLTAAAGLFTGPVADHYGQRRSIVIGLGFLAASATIIASAQHIFALAIGGLLGGLGLAMSYGVAFAVVSTHFSGDARRHALGMTQAAASVAVVAGVPTLVFLAGFVLWRGSFLILAVMLIAAMLVVLRALPPDATPVGRCASPRAILSSYRPLATVASTRALYLMSALRAIAVVGLSVYLGAFYDDVLHFSSREVGIAFMLEGGGLVLGNLVGGGRIGKYDQRRTFAAGTLAIGLGAFAIYTLRPEPIAIVIIAMTMAFIAGITFTSMTTMLAAEGTLRPATTMVLNISTIALGTAMGSALGGLLVRLGGYELIGIAALAVTLVTAVVALRRRNVPRITVPSS